MPDKPEILLRKDVARTRLFCVEQIDLKFSNGEQRQFERLKRGTGGGAVLIVPMIDNKTVLLVNEYAAGVDRYEVGLPKGKTEPEEPPLDAANRELMEEVGYGAHQLTLLTSFSLAPAYFEHTTQIVLAQDLYPKKIPGDEPEELEVIPWKIDDIAGLMASNQCTEARTIAALYMVRELLHFERMSNGR